MVKRIAFILAIASLLFTISSAHAEDMEIEATVGGHYTDLNGDKTNVKIGEYESMFEGFRPEFNFLLKGGSYDGIYFQGEGTIYDTDDQDYEGLIDLNRYITQEISYNRFTHWLDHDPLTNLYGAATTDGVTRVPPFVTYTDRDKADKEYGIVRSEINSKTTIRIPKVPFNLKTFFYFRREMRKGERQSLAMSKCSSCHIVGRTRKVDEATTDYNPGIDLEYSNEAMKISAHYEYLRRQYSDDSDLPENFYDDAVNPGTNADMDDRVIYDDERLEYDKDPDSKMDSHTANVNLYLNNIRTGIFVSGNYSEVKSKKYKDDFDALLKDTELRYIQKSVFSRLSTSIIPNLLLNFTFRWLKMENNDVYLDIDDEGFDWDFDPAFTRKSSMNREQYEYGGDAKYTVARWLSLRAGYTRKELERENYFRELSTTTMDDVEYQAIPEESKEDIYKGGIMTRFKLIGKKPARVDVNYTYKKIDTPYSNIMAAYVDDQTIPAGTFYWQLHNMRNTMLTNQPKESHEARADVKVPILDNLSFSAFYKYITRENDDSQDWESYSHMPSASLWYAPLEKLHLNVTYVYSYDKTGALVVVPVFDG
jgi:hypothetical protein